MVKRITRRTVLKTSVGLLRGMSRVSALPATIDDAAMVRGVARTVAIEPTIFNLSESKTVDLTSAADPAGTRGAVCYVTSSGVETTHYAFSIANVRKADLTLAEIESLTYDYYINNPDHNTIGDAPGVAPDEVWLLVQESGSGKSGGQSASASREVVFRTWNTEVQPDTWHTRHVDLEFRWSSQSPWKRLSIQTASFDDIEPNLKYDDTRVLGVGIGRGDPVAGPSILDIYYDQLSVNNSE